MQQQPPETETLDRLQQFLMEYTERIVERMNDIDRPIPLWNWDSADSTFARRR